MINGTFETAEERNLHHNENIADDMQNTAAGGFRDLMAVRSTHEIRKLKEIIQEYEEMWSFTWEKRRVKRVMMDNWI